MIPNLILRNRVRELRTRLNLRQSDLAKEVGVTRQTVLAIEKGRLNPSVSIALKLARVLREPVDYVFFLASVSEEAETSQTQGRRAGAETGDAKGRTSSAYSAQVVGPLANPVR